MVTPSLRKDGRWGIQIYIGKVNGIRKYYTVYGKTEQECMENYIDFKYKQKNNLLEDKLEKYNLANKGKLEELSGILTENIYKEKDFIYLFDNFLKERLAVKKIIKVTYDDYFGCINKNLKKILHLKLNQITLEIIKNEYKRIQCENGDNLVIRVNTILKPFFNKMAKTKKIEYNYLDEIEIPKKVTEQRAECSLETLSTLITLLKKEKQREYLYFIVLVQSFFGTRISEALALDREKSIIRKKKYIYIFQQQSCEKGKGYHIVNRVKTPKSNRNIKYLDAIMKEIDACYYRQEQYFKINNIKKDPKYKTLLILNERGSMVIENTAHRHWKEFIDKYKNKFDINEKITFHSFRRFFSDWLYQQGVDIKVVKEYMGHTNTQQTEDYQFQDLEYSEQEMQKVEAPAFINT